MGGEDQGLPQELFEETTGQMGIPGVAVNKVHLLKGAGHKDVPEDGLQQSLVSRLLKGKGEVHLDTLHLEIGVRLPLLPEAQHLDEMPPPSRAANFSVR